ncbi:vps9 domain protein [Ophiostoma piceae UAMH 11346]|uniref:Vps9 domain protein n=1 Tax=Ophiostoma piceae (strain UAMH 11346) TaxID=1262450 RepID=S3CRK1_OPHP1|nr:vps9 domain protein [Ophiostoma piceae UAMH 11346]
MPAPLNPFLAAFFRNPLSTQCTPSNNYILLVPSTEVLITCRDTESGTGGTAFADLPNLDEFLGSHVIRMPNPRVAAAAANAAGGKDGVMNLREMRGKARPYGTANSRSVVIKDNAVYTNKGFKTLTHALLITDAIWYADTIEPKPWLIYYISRPLLGTWEEVKMLPAILAPPPPASEPPATEGSSSKAPAQQKAAGAAASSDPGPSVPRKKDIKNFHELLSHFPIIARQMQPGLDRVFREFREAFDKRFPPEPPQPTQLHAHDHEADGPAKTALKKARTSDDAHAASSGKPPVKIQDAAPEIIGSPAENTNHGGAANGNIPNDIPSISVDGADGSAVAGNAAGDGSSGGGNNSNGNDSNASNSLLERLNGSNSSIHSSGSQGETESYYTENDDDEQMMRTTLETAITTAIDVFQEVDKQQLSLLGATTDLTGPLVEGLIERYIAEYLHHIIFPRLTSIKRPEDLELEAKIRQMDCIDISQLGMDIDGGPKTKHGVTIALGQVVEEFRKMSSAASPQEMLAILLSTVKAVSQLTYSSSTTIDVNGNNAGNNAGPGAAPTTSEKPLLTINADTLVSLLLFIVIRSQQRHLLARVNYMRHFIFIDDVDTGEMGYALSTFEAVLAYLVHNSSGLRRASRRNKALWEATASGNIEDLKSIMEPVTDVAIEDDDADADDLDSENGGEGASSSSRPTSSAGWPPSFASFTFSRGRSASSLSSRRSSIILNDADAFSQGSGLGHVFPFQADGGSNGAVDFSVHFPIKRTKKVALDTRSMSTSSEVSYRSRATSRASNVDGSVEGDVSVERLSQTHNSFGESLLMMAVQHEQVPALEYFLGLRQYFPTTFVLQDINHEDTTLLSAAVQLGNKELIQSILRFLAAATGIGKEHIEAYFALQDIWGRSVAHYLFHAPFLIKNYGTLMPWRQRDKNGQTPLFALCRSYDNALYLEMVSEGINMATITQGDNDRLHLDDHIDVRGNTLLHIVNNPQLALRIMQTCEVNVNAANDKRFTPLMVASKYGRFAMVQTLFRDPRVDVGAKELRGLTAVELAKDDDMRNKIDDLTLLSMPPGPDSRTTAVVRSYFVEDASVRFVVKSSQAVSSVSYAVTTCRRSQTDFEHLTKQLAIENPASWIPSITGLRSPFQIPSKPSRAMLKDMQLRMDWFLRMMLAHPTFAQHEMLWEFILVPDINPDMMAQRTRLKADTRAEKVRDEMEPLEDVREVEQFVDHARELLRGLNFSTKSVIRRANATGFVAADFHDAAALLARQVERIPGIVPTAHLAALDVYAQSWVVPLASPILHLQAAFLAMQSTVDALLVALAKPPRLILQIQSTRKQVEREYQSLSRSTRWPLGLLDETRQRAKEEREERARKSEAASEDLSRELRYTQQTVAGELAGWQDMHEKMGRRVVREYARAMLVQEQDRLQGMQRALRHVREADVPTPGPGNA